MKLVVQRNLITLEDLYTKKEQEICESFATYFSSWSVFNEADVLIRSETLPDDVFSISFDTKKRNTIPLIQTTVGAKRIIEVCDDALAKYNELNDYQDSKYAYVKKIRKVY